MQDSILREEFARWGDQFSGIDRRFVDKEEDEYEAADVITVPSEFALRSFIAMGIRSDKLRKIPYGVDLSTFGKVATPATDRFTVLFVGQVSFRKGVPHLLHAFARVRHARKRLRIVGGLQPEMKRYFERFPPTPDVEIVGHLPQAHLRSVMSEAHVLVLPSVEEGLALVQAQALACGCPVIGTLSSGAADLFTDGVEGFIVPPRDPAVIAERLQLLADDPERRRQMSDCALRRVTTLGGWDDYGQRIAELLSDIVRPNIRSQEPRIADSQGTS
jgi:glycosyltransferase involved in cell wall biosynthesis